MLERQAQSLAPFMLALAPWVGCMCSANGPQKEQSPPEESDVDTDTDANSDTSRDSEYWAYVDTALPEGPWRQISVGHNHACGLRADDSILCWGNGGLNFFGELDVPPGAYAQAAAATNATCALTVDGQVICWGTRWPGLLDTPEGTFIALDAKGSWACAVREDRSIVCWGNSADIPQPPVGLLAERVSVGGRHACALDAAGLVTCWGYSGRTGPPADPFVDLCSGMDFSCGLTTNNTMRCWGDGQLLDPSPVVAETGHFSGIDCNWYSRCAIRDDGELSCVDSRAFEPIPQGPYARIDVGASVICVIRRDGSAACWGAGDPNGFLEVPE